MADRQVTFDILAKDRASSTLEGVGGKFSKLGKVAGTVGKGIALGIGGAAVGGVAALGAAMVQGVKDAASYQTLAAKSAAVLKSTGNAAGTSVAQIQYLAGELESLSGIDEELIINGQNVLATFTGIQNKAGEGNDIFDQATKTIVDMSAALGTDMQGSAIQLGKALNDPIKGVSALSRVGVSFTKQQKDQIKTLVESGDTMGAQKIILAELKKEFGGAAEAAGSGFEGSLARAKDAVGDLFRNLGAKLLPVVTRFANFVSEKLVPGITAFFEGLRGSANDDEYFGTYLAKINLLGIKLWRTFEKIKPALIALGRSVAQVGGWFKNTLAPAVRDTVEKVMPMFKFALDNIKKAFGDTGGKGDAFKKTMQVVGMVVTKIFQAIVLVVAAFAVSFSIQMRAAMLVIDKVVLPAIRLIWKVFSAQVGFILSGAAKAFGWIPGIGPKLQTAAREFQVFADKVNKYLNGIDDEQVNIRIRTVLTGQGKGLKGNQVASKIRQIPALASGGVVMARPGGTLVQVGEGGEDEAVVPLSKLRGGIGGGGDTHVHIHTPAVITDNRQLLRLIDQAKASAARNRVYVSPARA